jgi:DNA-binding transcriptional ArsR family regulator
MDSTPTRPGRSSREHSGTVLIPMTGAAVTEIIPPISRFSRDDVYGIRKQTVLDRLGAKRRRAELTIVEHLWSPAGATSGNRWQMHQARKRLKQVDPQPSATDGNGSRPMVRRGSTVRVRQRASGEFYGPHAAIEGAHVRGHLEPPCHRSSLVLYNSTTNPFIPQGDEMTLPHPLPDDLVELIARRFRAIGEPMRIRLLDQLRDGEATVSELSETVGASQQNISKHLAVLADVGILGRRKDGNRVYYRIVDEGVLTLCEDVCGSLQEQLRSLSALVDLGAA